MSTELFVKLLLSSHYLGKKWLKKKTTSIKSIKNLNLELSQVVLTTSSAETNELMFTDIPTFLTPSTVNHILGLALVSTSTHVCITGLQKQKTQTNK